MPSPTWFSRVSLPYLGKLQRCPVPDLAYTTRQACSPKGAGSVLLYPLQPQNLIWPVWLQPEFDDQARAQETGFSGRNDMVGRARYMIPHARPLYPLKRVSTRSAPGGQSICNKDIIDEQTACLFNLFLPALPLGLQAAQKTVPTQDPIRTHSLRSGGVVRGRGLEKASQKERNGTWH